MALNMLASGELHAALPLDDAALLDATRPKVKGGAVNIDPAT
jgi:hypothetical protein